MAYQCFFFSFLSNFNVKMSMNALNIGFATMDGLNRVKIKLINRIIEAETI